MYEPEELELGEVREEADEECARCEEGGSGLCDGMASLIVSPSANKTVLKDYHFVAAF